MRCLTRMGLGLIGLALVVPTAALADPPQSPTSPSAGKKSRSKPSTFRKAHLCAQCQWSDLRAKGINAPPPPQLPTGGLVMPGDHCDRCGAATGTYAVPPMVSSMAPPPPPVMAGPDPAAAPLPPPMMSAAAPGGMGAPSQGNVCVNCEAANGAAMPGRAVVGGEMPGYAAVSGAVPISEPMPIGVIQGRYAYQNPGQNPNPGPNMNPNVAMGAPGMPMPGGRPGPGPGPGARGRGPSDPSVMPSSFATEPYVPGGRSRPHILSHLFGLDAIGRRGRDDRERRERENHASISYQPQAAQPSELPASMVYGR